MQDIVKRYVKKNCRGRMELVISKLLTVFWGVVCIFFAFFVGGISDTIIESINKIGSLVNGPLLAVFLMGMLTRRVNGQGATGGLIVGFVLNLLLWKYAPENFLAVVECDWLFCGLRSGVSDQPGFSEAGSRQIRRHPVSTRSRTT